MAESLLKALKNEVTVIGRLKQVNLEEDTDRNGNERIKGDVIIQVKEVDKEHDIKIDVYSRKYKQDGTINGLYEGFKKVEEEYKSIENVENAKDADLVKAQGSLGLREYISQDGKHVKYNNLRGKFFNRIDREQVKKERGPKAVANVEVIIENFKDVTDSEGLPTGDKKVNVFNVDFFGTLNDRSKPIIPIECVLEEELADTFENLYDKNDTGKLTLKINNYAEEVPEEEVEKEVSGFGVTEELEEKVSRRFVNNLQIIGGTEAYQNGREYDEDMIAESKEWRQKSLNELESGYVPQDKNAFGEGSQPKKNEKKEEPKKEEVSEDSIPDFDDLDLDF